MLRNGIEIFPPMIEAIRQACFSVDLLTFVYWKGAVARRFADALIERAKAGVRVRVILDAIGALKMSKSLIEQMRAAGVHVAWFRPPARWQFWKLDNRTHRKVLVCDGRIAFTGGVGIAEEWEGDARNPNEWRDTHFQVEGPAVPGLQAAFLDNWVEAGRPMQDDVTQIGYAETLQPLGKSHIQVVKTTAAVNWSPIATLFHVLLTLARHKVRITTAYFVPNAAMVQLLKKTAQRGVDVQVLIPGPHHNHRMAQLAQEDEYVPLMQAGVRMWRYQPSMLHAKIITVDDVVACVGSANFDQRSMSKDDELALLILDEAVLSELDRHFEEDRTRAMEMHAEDYHQLDLFRRAKTTVASLFRNQT
ncbi:phospholipase D-like domain-containing protein [Halomonas korlensis]|uniref:phospholipase D-like domain-containing protein n=1 Tax=Halomonas korlensis TaxID=463301 RepID=UPI001C316068|nr:phospholipase D-like domain-containing protein [Halomonas korlensis]